MAVGKCLGCVPEKQKSSPNQHTRKNYTTGCTVDGTGMGNRSYDNTTTCSTNRGGG